MKDMNIFELFYDQDKYIKFGKYYPNNIFFIGSYDMLNNCKFFNPDEREVLIFENDIPKNLDKSLYESIDLSKLNHINLDKYYSIMETSEIIDDIYFNILSCLSKKDQDSSKKSILGNINIFFKKEKKASFNDLVNFFEKESTTVTNKLKILKKINKIKKMNNPNFLLKKKNIFFNFSKANKIIQNHILNIISKDTEFLVYIENMLGLKDNEKLFRKLIDGYIERNQKNSAIISHIVIKKDNQWKSILENVQSQIFKYSFRKIILSEVLEVIQILNKKNTEIQKEYRFELKDKFSKTKTYNQEDFEEIGTPTSTMLNLYAEKKWDDFLELGLIMLGYTNIENKNKISNLINYENKLNYSVFSAKKDEESFLFYLVNKKRDDIDSEHHENIEDFKKEKYHHIIQLFDGGADLDSISGLFSQVTSLDQKNPGIYSYKWGTASPEKNKLYILTKSPSIEIIKKKKF